MAEIFATGLQMGESARWHEGRFWMCDWLAGELLAFSSSGDREVVARFEGLPASVDWLPDGRPVLTTNAGVVAGTDLAPYGPPGEPFNEIVVDADGRIDITIGGVSHGANTLTSAEDVNYVFIRQYAHDWSQVEPASLRLELDQLAEEHARGLRRQPTDGLELRLALVADEVLQRRRRSARSSSASSFCSA